MRDAAVKDVFVLFELLPDATAPGLLTLNHSTVVPVDSAHHPAARAALKSALRGDGEAAKVPLVLVRVSSPLLTESPSLSTALILTLT